MTDFDSIKRDYSMPDIAAKAGVALQQDGHEWRACCPFHGENTPSFTIYQRQNGWHYHCFGCGAHGDNVDLVAELYQVDNREAVSIITGEEKRQPVERKQWVEAKDPYAGYSVIRPPTDADEIRPGRKTPPILNPKRIDPATGKPKVIVYTPSEVYPYRTPTGKLRGYVLRMEFDGKKLTPGVWWTTGPDWTGWSHGRLPEPRPLYGDERLSASPTKQVLLVEGEKCADRANATIGHLVTAVTWPGGGKSAHKADWKRLAGRSVVCWPDNDEEGRKTFYGWRDDRGDWRKGIFEMLFEAGAKRIKVVAITPSERPDGWDIADAVDHDKLSSEAIALMMKAQVREWTRAAQDDYRKGVMEPKAEAPEEKKPEQRPAVVTKEINDHTWRDFMIMNKDGSAIKSSSIQNISLILQYEPRFTGIFAWNDFAKEVYLMRQPPWEMRESTQALSAQRNPQWSARLIKDTDVTSAAGWLEYCGLAPKRSDVGAVIARVAEHNKFNPVVEALDALEWDGTSRINGDPGAPWLTYYLGAEHTEVNRKFGEKWLIGAVARAYQPGCKMDNMLILEGPQGLRKSTALKVLADAVTPNVFTDEISDPGSKDAGLQMQGRWIVEIAELDAFRSAEVTTLKAWLARTDDRFRRPYGKIVETFPRACVMAGTVNPSGIGYLKDPTGARRFWPVYCSSIDLEALKQDARQLWAEAKHMYQSGTPWYFTKDEDGEPAEAQRARSEMDPWEDIIAGFLLARTRVTVKEIMDHLEIAKERRSTAHDRRIRHYLHRMEWVPNGDRTFSRKEEETLL